MQYCCRPSTRIVPEMSIRSQVFRILAHKMFLQCNQDSKFGTTAHVSGLHNILFVNYDDVGFCNDVAEGCNLQMRSITEYFTVCCVLSVLTKCLR